jgi:hypothetical protein
VGVAGGNIEALLRTSPSGFADRLSPFPEIDRLLGSGGRILSCGVCGDRRSMNSSLSEGLAGTTRFILAMLGFREGVRKGAVRGLLNKVVGDDLLIDFRGG